jgi:hypothetical protein
MGYLEVFNWEQRTLFKLSGNECQDCPVGCVDVINSLPRLRAKLSGRRVRRLQLGVCFGQGTLIYTRRKCLLMFTDPRYAAISWIDEARMLQRGQDQRKGFRRQIRRAAEVFFGAHEPAVRCVIWDMSEGGARLAVARPLADLPTTFTLVLSSDNTRRNCQVVWTDKRYVGVKFI